MDSDRLADWANGLPQVEAQLMLLRAAKEHTAKFTNSELIGMEWSKKLREHGYDTLCPYARNFMAHCYLDHCDNIAGRHKIKVV